MWVTYATFWTFEIYFIYYENPHLGPDYMSRAGVSFPGSRHVC